jgi:Uma2 family endonuclease
MIIKATPAVDQEQAASLPYHHFTVKQYHRMIESGILRPDDHVELLNGWILDRMPHTPPHDGAVTRINRQLVRLLPEQWLLRVQCAITLPASEPEPDFVVVRGPEDLYLSRHPGPRDIAMLIEVADSTLLHDRRAKGLIYAQARIPRYWIVNLVESKVETYSRPKAGKGPAYRQQHDYGLDESVPLTLGDQLIGKLAVRDLLPKVPKV